MIKIIIDALRIIAAAVSASTTSNIRVLIYSRSRISRDSYFIDFTLYTYNNIFIGKSYVELK